uniref:Uncharacterized protein n=1 Tax=Meloidogyne javanica TaxID=6303 RepID=A0A915LFA7_MELJA
MPAQDEIIRNIGVVAKCLDALRDKHKVIKNKLTGGIDLLMPDERQLTDEKISIVDKNLENILLGVEEAQVMVELASYFQKSEADKQKYKAQVRRLCQENAEIRDELSSTRQQLRTAMQNIAQLEEENKLLKFMNSIKKFDEDLPELGDKDGEQAEQQRTASDAHNSTLQEGFGVEEEDLQKDSSSEDGEQQTPNVPMVKTAAAKKQKLRDNSKRILYLFSRTIRRKRAKMQEQAFNEVLAIATEAAAAPKGSDLANKCLDSVKEILNDGFTTKENFRNAFAWWKMLSSIPMDLGLFFILFKNHGMKTAVIKALQPAAADAPKAPTIKIRSNRFPERTVRQAGFLHKGRQITYKELSELMVYNF